MGRPRLVLPDELAAELRDLSRSAGLHQGQAQGARYALARQLSQLNRDGWSVSALAIALDSTPSAIRNLITMTTKELA